MKWFKWITVGIFLGFLMLMATVGTVANLRQGHSVAKAQFKRS